MERMVKGELGDLPSESFPLVIWYLMTMAWHYNVHCGSRGCAEGVSEQPEFLHRLGQGSQRFWMILGRGGGKTINTTKGSI